jgi:hypothetical protein
MTFAGLRPLKPATSAPVALTRRLNEDRAKRFRQKSGEEKRCVDFGAVWLDWRWR